MEKNIIVNDFIKKIKKWSPFLNIKKSVMCRQQVLDILQEVINDGNRKT